MGDLALFQDGCRWVLLDERAHEIGDYDSKSDALAAADAYVSGLAEARYILINDDGWREALLEPARH
jgi:hypothetical protein